MNLPTIPPPSQSQTFPPLKVRQRPDLVAVETRHKNDSAMVVKDPIALKYHRLRPDEYFVLQMLNGQNSLEDIRIAYEARFRPTRVTHAQINQLLFRFHQSGLTLSNASLQGDRLDEKRRKDFWDRWKQHISGVLFIRFPGVDPEPLMRRIYPPIRPFLGRLGMCVAATLCIVAAVLFAGQWERFASEFPKMNDWLRFDALFMLAIVIGGTKILHELGHAITCKHFGGECHQIGPMLLVFTPALYCDTSDSWMLPSRWQRAAVGAAGIGVECFLAALATFVWAYTGPGLTHYCAMNVMLVCSVSTLLFNANPLLRYDGYYVLSDLCDVTNMAEKSRKLLASTSGSLIFGVEEPDPEAPEGSYQFWLFVYAIAAFVYRWSLTLMILWFVSLILRPYGLESVGRLLCVFAAGGMLFTLFRTPVQFLKNPARRRLIKMKRVAISAVCAVGLIIASLWPLPSGLSTSARIVPRSESPLYISTAGQLAEMKVKLGDSVVEGDAVAILSNPDVQLQYVQAKGRYETQQEVVDSIRRSQINHVDAANELPAALSLLDELRKQMETRKSRVDGLTLRAPASGKLIAAPRRAAPTVDADQVESRLVSWSGYPTDPENQNCLLEAGSELLSVALDDRWDAEITLGQTQVQRINIGADVKLILESMPSKTFTGTVSDISRSRWQPEQNAQRRDDPEAVQRGQPPATSYVVRVALNPTERKFVTGATAATRITAKPISLVGRAKRLLNSIFRFR